MISINFENTEQGRPIHKNLVQVSLEDNKSLAYYTSIDDAVNWLWLSGFKETARKFNNQYKKQKVKL